MFFSEEKIKKNKNKKFNNILFWDCDKKNIDIKKMKEFIVERVIHMGKDEDFYALFNNYGGIENVKKIIKNLKYIDEHDIGFVCAVFEIKKEELKCLKKRLYKRELMNYLKK